MNITDEAVEAFRAEVKDCTGRELSVELVRRCLSRALPHLSQGAVSEEGEVVAWSYEHHEFGDVWARGVILNRPDGGANAPTAHHGSPVRSVTPLVRLSTLTACQQEVERLREVLEPFALVAEHDIGEGESDDDIFWPISNARYSMAGRLRVGHLRRARAALGGQSNE